MEKIKKLWKNNRKVVVCVSITCGGMIVSYVLGQKRGKTDFIRDLINISENRNGNLVFSADEVGLKNKFGYLMYEIHADCIGD